MAKKKSTVLYAPIPEPTWPDKNNFVSWPDHWPKYRNGSNEPCDMLIGLCGCGAAHAYGEFRLRLDPADRRSEAGRIERYTDAENTDG